MKDIFDRIKEKRGDIFTIALKKKKDGDVFQRVEKQLPALAKGYIKEQIAEIKTLSPEQVNEIVEEAISKAPAKVVEKVIKQEIVRPVEKAIEKDYAPLIEALEKKIEELKDQLDQTRGEVRIVGTLLPNFSNENGTFLKATKGRLDWDEAGGADTETTKYFGDSETDGSWRLIVSGTSLLHQRRESGAWVTKFENLA